MQVSRTRILVPAIIAGALAGAFAVSRGTDPVVGKVPDRLADSTFWRLFSQMSEPDGYFRSDNFVSNEAAFQYVIPDLKRRVQPGGVYVGVGPDQNFTYIVAFQPSIAFIVDIRRQNAMQHLLYKALIELSADRADFLSRLFARPRPAGLDTTTTVPQLFAAYGPIDRDTLLQYQTLDAVKRHLRESKGFALSEADLASLEYVYRAFTDAGPGITYSFRQGYGGGFGRGGHGMPSYAWLLAEDDGKGVSHSYIATEANYRALKRMQHRNLIVPIVGDFAGEKALRGVGQWARRHGATVSLFYTSNVEQYLFQQGDDWARFYRNVESLPLAVGATFIRSVSNRMAGQIQNPDSRSVQLVLPIKELISAFDDGKIRTYHDVVEMSR